jgi:hypothetical protein
LSSHVPLYRVHHSRVSYQSPHLLRRTNNRLCELSFMESGGSNTYEECIQSSPVDYAFCGETTADCRSTGCVVTSVPLEGNTLYRNVKECEDNCSNYGFTCPETEGGIPIRKLNATVKKVEELKCYDCSSAQGGPTATCGFKSKSDGTTGYLDIGLCQLDADKKCGWKYGCSRPV